MARSIAAPGSARRLGHRALGVRAPAPSRRPGRGWSLPSLGLPRALHAPGHAVATGFATVWRHRRARIALLAVLGGLPLLGGGWLWLRHSSLVAVEHVRVSGLSRRAGARADNGAIEARLDEAARRMSTLDVKQAALAAAVAGYPIVRAVHARARVPHGLDIEVVEQPPVAALEVAGVRTAVAADGVVLGPSYLSSSLPLVHAGAAAARRAGEAIPAIGRRVSSGYLLDELTVLGAAPKRLVRYVTGAYFGQHGLTVAFRGGLVAYFGDGTRAHAKWLSLALVLADSGSAGATYVDVRLPERPAAGFPAGTVAPGMAGAGGGQGAGEQPGGAAAPATAAELAAGLNAGVSGGLSTSEPSAGATGAAGGRHESGAGGEAGAGTESGTGSGASTGASTGTGGEAGASVGAGSSGETGAGAEAVPSG